jgi:hypothetical protein
MRSLLYLILIALFIQTSMACDDEEETDPRSTDLRSGTTSDMSPEDRSTTEDPGTSDQRGDIPEEVNISHDLFEDAAASDLTVPDAVSDTEPVHDLGTEEMSVDGHDDTVEPDLNALTGCDQILDAFWIENDFIRGCESDAQCGQVLYGTSCGCSQDWVALIEADISRWEALKDMALGAGCELPFMSDCSCPEADGYACVSGVCTWNYL